MTRRALRQLALAAPLAAAGAGVWAMGGGSHHNMVLGRMVAARADAPSLAVTQSARSHFILHCAGCHGIDGSGAPERYVPDLRRLGLFLRVPGGREFVISVPGVMGSGLTDLQVAEVTNWVLTGMAAHSVPPGQPPYTREEVARARAAPLADVAATRSRLVGAGRSAGIAID